MALFAISDLHLSLGTDKPMYVFGDNWKDYESKLKKNWEDCVCDEDFVIINGDNSWATYLENAKDDFAFINSLPGKKILTKGNHDYWWTTMKKMNDFCRENGLDTISFLQNNHFMYGDMAICGTRGWQLTCGDEQDLKIHSRELERLRLSFNSAKASTPAQIIVALHYPPDEAFKALMQEHGVTQCYYGHLHGNSHRLALVGMSNSIKYQLVSCDFLDFKPFKIC
ncbi:MAG: metallophosphoesterase [Eubacteriales bacterium]|jgi:predicted phosphohydrolase|nr:metallophosphoesterase [Eubacteriales bacterium]